MKASYNNLLMIYYSGTGNAKRVSEWIVEDARLRGMRTHICSFRDFRPEDVSDFEGQTLIGFFSATHGFNMPHSMLKFIFRFRWLQGSDVFIGNTRAGMKMGRFFLPGLSGIAMYFPALIMLLKGYKLKAMYPVDLPSNWISLHPGLRRKVIDSMVTHYERLTKQFSARVLSGQKVFLKSFVLLPLDILVTFTCESCMRCMNYCPQRAIETAHSLFFVLLFLLVAFVNPFLSDLVANFVANWLGYSRVAYESFYFVLQWSVALLVFYLGYKLMHLLMRIPVVNKVLTYTSLTTWKFWRRYKMPAQARPKGA